MPRCPMPGAANDNGLDEWDTGLARLRNAGQVAANCASELRMATACEAQRRACEWWGMVYASAYPDRAALAWALSECFGALIGLPAVL